MNLPLDFKKIDALVRGLDDYEVQKPLGSGGMGLIYLVRQKLTNRLEVLKVLRPELAERQRLKDRFLREVQIAAKLDHPNVVKTYTALDRGFLGLVIEYVPGMDLHSMVRKLGPLRIDIAATIVAQAARGLEHAVSRGLVHRDIKPSNILVSKVDKRFLAKLSDFGLCKDIELNETDGLTIEGRFLGTPEYVAPEQALDPANSTVASDIYGLGCTLFFALTGRPPYTGTNTLAVLNAHINAPIPDVREFRQDVPDSMRLLLEGMLQKDARARFQSPQLVAERLEVLLQAPSGSIATVPEPAPASVASIPAPAGHDVPQTPLMPASSSGSTFPRRPVAKRTKKSSISFSLIAQILMPIIFLTVIVLYLQPWVPPNTKGTVVTDVTPEVLVKVGAQIINPGKEPIVKVSMEAGVYPVQYLYEDHLLAEETIELVPRQLYTLKAKFPDLARRFPKPTVPQFQGKVIAPNPRTSEVPIDSTVELAQRPRDTTSEPESTPPPPPPPPKESEYKLIPENLAGWKVEPGRVIAGLDIPPTRLALLPKEFFDKSNDVVATLAPRVQAWDIELGSTVPLPAPYLNLNSLSIAPKSKMVMYANDYLCEVYIPPKQIYQSPMDMNTKRIYALSADSKFLGCCDYSESFYKWNFQSSKPEPSSSSRQPIGRENVKALALTGRLEQCVVLSNDGKLLCWDTTKGDPLGETATNMAHPPMTIHLSSQPNQVITVSIRGECEIRKLPKLELVAGYQLFNNFTTASAASNRMLAVADSSGQVCVVDLTSSALAARLPHKADCQVSALAFSADGKWLAVGYDNSSIGLFQVKRQTVPKP